MRYIGITTTIPVEIIFAAGAVPVDLNNLFISNNNRENFVKLADLDGFPRNVCTWIKGIYGTVLGEGMKEIIAVIQGDCSNTHAMAETLIDHGVKIYPFSFPYNYDSKALRSEMERLAEKLRVSSWDEIINWKKRLDVIRQLAHEIDRLSWQENKVKGLENHTFLVSTSDFEGNPDKFEKKLMQFINDAKKRKSFENQVRLCYMGVPPLYGDIYDVLEGYGARVVLNEVQRQFSMPFETDDIVEQYLRYTYPYGAFRRLEDIKLEITKRNIHGVIHYAEQFCFRQIEDIIFRREIGVPYILIEGGEVFSLDARTKMRLQAFVEMLRSKIGNSRT